MIKKPGKKVRVRNPAQTRANLLKATIDLLAHRGADGVSMKEVARAANVSRAVAYQHFADRDHLLREAKISLSDRLLDSVEDLDSSSMEAQVNSTARIVLGNREAYRVLIADALAGKDLDSEHPLLKVVSRMLEHSKASGDARDDIDVEILSFIMIGSIATLVMLSWRHGGVDDLAARFTSEWGRILRQGILTNAKRPALKRPVASPPPRPPPPHKDAARRRKKRAPRSKARWRLP
jgi:AcrR family transcriptional regulator